MKEKKKKKKVCCLHADTYIERTKKGFESSPLFFFFGGIGWITGLMGHRFQRNKGFPGIRMLRKPKKDNGGF